MLTMSGIVCGEHLKPSHYKIGGMVDMLDTEMRIQVQYRDLPSAVLYDVGLLRLIRQSNIDMWLNNGHEDFQNLLSWYLNRHAQEMKGIKMKGLSSP